MVTGAWDTAGGDRGVRHIPLVACGFKFDCTDALCQLMMMDSSEHFNQIIPSHRSPSPSYPLLQYLKVDISRSPPVCLFHGTDPSTSSIIEEENAKGTGVCSNTLSHI